MPVAHTFESRDRMASSAHSALPQQDWRDAIAYPSVSDALVFIQSKVNCDKRVIRARVVLYYCQYIGIKTMVHQHIMLELRDAVDGKILALQLAGQLMYARFDFVVALSMQCYRSQIQACRSLDDDLRYRCWSKTPRVPLAVNCSSVICRQRVERTHSSSC